MVNPSSVEVALLTVVSRARAGNWLPFSFGDLRNRLKEADPPLDSVSDSEMVECILFFEARFLLEIRKYLNLTYHPFDRSASSIDHYLNQFFGIGTFELKLTHEGRKVIAQSRPPVDVGSTTPPAEMDDLLPLLRRKEYDKDIQDADARFQKEGLPFGLVLIDVDNFGRFNKTHGIKVGDMVLIGVSEIVNLHVRMKGKAYRYGGEEIVIILPNYSKREAAALAETIRISFERSPISNLDLKVTASFGAAAIPEDAKDKTELFHLADAALRSAKQTGRNRVVAAGASDRTTETTTTAMEPSGQSGQKDIPSRVEHARVSIQWRSAGVIPTTAIKLVEIFGSIENLSTSKRISEYSCTLSVPKSSISFNNAIYPSEIPSTDSAYRRFRHTERNHTGASIHPGDRFQIISLQLAVAHLSAADQQECLKMEVIADATADDEAFRYRKTVAELMR